MGSENIEGLILTRGLFLVLCFRKKIRDFFLIVIGERTTISGILKNIIMPTPQDDNYFIEIFDDSEEKIFRIKILKEDYEKIMLKVGKEKIYISVFCLREENKLIALEFEIIENYLKI